jgi:beta-phosphoglucomutase-like phosphatase (HAD superfamily)
MSAPLIVRRNAYDAVLFDLDGVLTPAVVSSSVTGAAGLRGKPAPDGLLETARRLQVVPCRAVVVQDAPGGVAA